MLAQLEKQFLQADLAQVRQLLADGQAHDDPIAVHQYAQRVARLEKELTELSEAGTNAPVGVALFFGGARSWARMASRRPSGRRPSASFRSW